MGETCPYQLHYYLIIQCVDFEKEPLGIQVSYMETARVIFPPKI